jgi:hypothetical protein
MSKFQDAMRRVITGDDLQGQSVIVIDGGPSSEIGKRDLGGLFEIWEDTAFGPLTPSAHEDLGTTRPVLGPRKVISRCVGSSSVLCPRAFPSRCLTLPCANVLPNLTALVTSSIRHVTRGCMRRIQLTSSVSCREKHL